MEEKDTSQNVDTKGATSKTTARAAFPRISLNKVLELAKTIYELGEGDPVPRLVVFDKMNKSPDSGPSRMIVTTSNGYGLTSGSYKAERLMVTDKGKNILTKKGVARTKVASEILLSNDLFSQFYTKYNSRAIPQEAIATDFLKQAGSLNDADAKTAFAIFVDNLQDFGFIKEMSGRQTILSLEMLLADLPADTESNSHDEVKPPSSKTSTSQRDETPPATPNFSQPKMLPQFNFNIQVQLPENGTPEVYDAIFKSMSEHLLKNYSE